MSKSEEELLKYILKNEKILKKNNIEIDTEVIKRSLDAYGKKEYIISVVGTMKSGKSTFINALIGDDLMPSENAACTLTTTSIRNSKNNLDKIIKKFEDKSDIEISGADLSLEFHNDIKETRNNKLNEKFHYMTEHKIEALKNLESYGEISLVDTPGLNEMEGLGISKKYINSIFDNQIKKSNFLIYIFDYKYYKAQENIEILERIIKLRKDIIYNKNIMFIINKIDLVTYKDGNIEDVVENVRKMIGRLGLKDFNIFCVSSKKALIARLMCDQSNLKKYKKEIDDLRPLIKKEIDGEILEVQMPIKDLQKGLLIDSNIQEFENRILANKYINVIDELDNSLKNLESIVCSEVLKKITKQVNKYKKNIMLYEEQKKIYEDKINLIREKINDIGIIISRINEKLAIPSYEEAKRKEMRSCFCVSSDYIYPYCDYDEYYRSESKAYDAGLAKFRKWKNSIVLQFDDIYKEYNYYLTGGDFVKNFNNKITGELEKISEIVNNTLKYFGRTSSERIITKFSVMLEPIMNLSYDNSTYYISDLYDNSKFISFEYSERYVKGILGERLKDVVMYDISNAIKNEEEDYEKAFLRCSKVFFDDYYEKKYKKFIPAVKKIVNSEIKKSEDIFRNILTEYFKECESFKDKEEKEYKSAIENIKELNNILKEIGE